MRYRQPAVDATVRVLHDVLLSSQAWQSLRGHVYFVTSVAWSSDGARLATGRAEVCSVNSRGEGDDHLHKNLSSVPTKSVVTAMKLAASFTLRTNTCLCAARAGFDKSFFSVVGALAPSSGFFVQGHR